MRQWQAQQQTLIIIEILNGSRAADADYKGWLGKHVALCQEELNRNCSRGQNPKVGSVPGLDTISINAH